MKTGDFMSDLQPILLTHFQPSGLMYLHSLLDGHKEILTIPGVPNIEILFNKDLKSAGHALDLFNQANEKFYDTSEMDMAYLNNGGLFRLGENADEGIVTPREEFERFFKKFMDENPLTTQNVILGLYYAYAKAHNDDLESKKVVLLHPHIHRNTLALHRIFPKAKCIVTLRDPERAYFSQSNLMRDKARIRNIPYNHLGLLSADAENVMPLVKHNIEMKIVRIEDFAKHSKYILSELCGFMGIEYDGALERSTFCGKKYWGANLSYKANEFSTQRHTLELTLGRGEKRILSLMNERLNKITGCGSLKLSPFERKIAFIWLLLPVKQDIEWFRENIIKANFKRKISAIEVLAKLVFERIRLACIFYRNRRADKEYEKIAESFIRYK